jgi:trimeric autotransporter adhesin
MAGLSGSLTAQPEYYNFNTNGSNNSFPFGMAGGKEVQLLYLAGDFNQPSPAPSGTIISISFRVGDVYPITNFDYTDFSIKMAQSTLTSFPAFSFYSPLTEVYYRSSVTFNAAGGTWLTITLDTPFPYDNTRSLIVE